MKIVAALTDPALASLAQEQGADMVELRFDLIEGDPVSSVKICKKVCIITHYRHSSLGTGRGAVFWRYGFMVREDPPADTPC